MCGRSGSKRDLLVENTFISSLHNDVRERCLLVSVTGAFCLGMIFFFSFGGSFWGLETNPTGWGFIKTSETYILMSSQSHRGILEAWPR